MVVTYSDDIYYFDMYISSYLYGSYRNIVLIYNLYNIIYILN